jgi:predicted O-methyltransferase YrrM
MGLGLFNLMESSMTTTFISPTVAFLISRLFEEAETVETAYNLQVQGDRRENRDVDPADYRQFYARLKDQPLAVSRETGTLLYILARAIGARTIVEFGTSFGISTIHLAAGLRDNGGGQLIGSEFERTKVERARQNIEAAGLSDLVEIREGDALETFARDLPDSIDLVLMDGAKALYPSVLALLEPRLRVGALIVADNADASPDYIARVRTFEHGYLSVPFADDVELSIRIPTNASTDGR